MFVGIRDILWAKGRFALIASVVGLITLLLVMLTGLTGGLASQNTSALEALGPDRFAFGAPVSESSEEGAGHDVEANFQSSQVTADQTREWKQTDGVTAADPVGFSQAQLAGQSGSAGVAVVGVPKDSGLVKRAAGSAIGGADEPGDGVVVSRSVAEEQGADVGQSVEISGKKLTVRGVVADQYYSHTPVIWVDTAQWQALAHVPSEGKGAVLGTVLALRGTLSDDDWTSTSAADGMKVTSVRDSFSGLPAYSSEHGSLLTMQGFLYGISALVTVSFLTVWTVQRTRDIAILRALGAGGRYLIRDAMGQAGIVLAVGGILGLGLGAGLGALVHGTVPFDLGLTTTLAPAAGIWVLGMLGSVLAVRRVASVDPLIALGGN